MALLAGGVHVRGHSVRRAFTLVELLVVLAIIAIVVGLTIPAVQMIRAAASRTECANHLRQLGLGLHQYHNAQRAFPPGVRDDKDKKPWLSWHARILPYLEQEELYRQTLAAFAKDKWFENNPPHVGFATVLPIFGCPADARTFDVGNISGLRVAMTSYLGNEGVNLFRLGGVLYLNSKVKFADIVDGSSNTLLVGERPPSADNGFGWWYGGWGQNKDGSCDMVLGVRERNFGHPSATSCPAGPYEFGPGRVQNQCDMFRFWSLHSGGAHFLFADGSTRFISYSAAPIMPALATRAGGEAVNSGDY